MIGEFDPFAYSAWVKAHPDNYVTMASIASDAKALHAIKTAGTMEELKKAFAGPGKAAKEAGDTLLLEMFKEAKDKRKEELSK